MSRTVEIHVLPESLAGRDLAGSVAAVIDVLRATTTIVHALAAGARAIIPCGDVETAVTRAAVLPDSERVLGGERQGVLIEGFDLDNSPLKYTQERVANRTVVFTTTNGTRALEMCLSADRILIAAFVNLSAVIRELAADDRPVHLVCAGNRGEESAEDVLCAGAIADGLVQTEPHTTLAGPNTLRAMEAYRDSARTAQGLYDAVRESPGFRDLVELGFEADIHRSLERDRFDFVPPYDRAAKLIPGPGFESWRIDA